LSARAAGVVVFVIGALAGAAALHFGWERPALDTARARAQVYEQDLAALRGHLDQANNAVAALEGRLLVEESTRRGLETGLRVMQDELGRARDSLAFYEQLMPPGPKGAISIRALDIERVGPQLRYRVLLMRSGTNDKAFEGSLQFVAEGRVNGEEASVTLLPTVLAAAQEAGASSEPGQTEAGVTGENQAGTGLLAVEFTEFQRSSGLLSLPVGFEPESVTVNVLEGRNVRTSRSIELAARSNLP